MLGGLNLFSLLLWLWEAIWDRLSGPLASFGFGQWRAAGLADEGFLFTSGQGTGGSEESDMWDCLFPCFPLSYWL